MKRPLTFLCVLALLLGCCSCVVPSTDEQTTPTLSEDLSEDLLNELFSLGSDTQEEEEPLLEYDDAISQHRYYYQSLSEKQQKNYDALYQEILRTDDTDTDISDFFEDDDPHFGVFVELPCPLGSELELDALYHAVFDDHPEIFYDSTLAYTYLTMPDGSNQYTEIAVSYFLNADQRKAAKAEVDAAVSALTADLKDASYSDYEKELLLHDRLTAQCEYDYESADLYDQDRTDEACDDSFSAYGALCKGKAVCEGYTRAMMLLLGAVDIPTVPVYNQDHVWNLVWIDGTPYHLDATWDDQDDVTVHSYFNITDEDILVGRDIYSQTPSLPACITDTDNYYVKAGTDLRNASRDDIICAAAAVIAEQDKVEMRFSEDEYADAYILFWEEDIFDLLLPFIGEDRLEEWSSFYILCDNELYTICLYL